MATSAAYFPQASIGVTVWSLLGLDELLLFGEYIV
jgi:hypothetical protein